MVKQERGKCPACKKRRVIQQNGLCGKCGELPLSSEAERIVKEKATLGYLHPDDDPSYP